jgi:hypothetical protein
MVERLTEAADVTAGSKYVGRVGEVRDGRALVLREGAASFWIDRAALRIRPDGLVELDVAALLSSRSGRGHHGGSGSQRHIKGLF